MTDRDDELLQERFTALRNEDAARTPRFQAQRVKRPATRMLWWLAAAAVLVLGVSLALGKRSPGLEQSLSQWRSPTAALLRARGFETPSLFSSALGPRP
jgi:anti-sigma factor RsiW